MAGYGFVGGGTYLGNKFDNILRNNDCENGIWVEFKVEFRTNATMTQVKESRLMDVRVA